jgi:hypothetical protein
VVARGKFFIDKIESFKNDPENKLKGKADVMENQKQELEEKA